ncbi:recombinase family protein [Pseudomonas alloputida]|uniref:Recombinase family protein n=1 Tax=Pseudomonas alloputida TaxID=1940621 RepID=A0AAW7HQR0_9PSED|nr:MULTISPECIES: recombinase family protein [Pseudomonas]MCE0864451.1 recombinase family protein [Pseudomonas alloputida]MCE0870306.1 recombinase family protein [Pseudomonas alloputida]MCE0893577.1 recombinase family protein [Pseudomonas alloputida]MCE0911198.1 recombinase family protein [Pseudomonas kurunegalensis]MCE0922814.1 recombinase family protein [Pseudomonas alloputida]
MARVGYIRVSSADQNVDRQLDGVALDKVFTEKLSGATTDRPQLQAMLEYVREGDTILVHSIDRLARSLADLLKLVEDLNKRSVHIRFNKEQLEFTGEDNPTQHLMLSMMGAVAQFERAMIKERQREGIAKAKEKGVYKGRSKSVDDAAIRAAVSGGLSFRKAAESLRVSLSTVQRAMKANV